MNRSIVARLLIVVGISTFVATGWFALRQGETEVQGVDQTGVGLQGVDLLQLAEDGIVVSQSPEDYAADASIEDAISEASKFQDSATLGAELVHLKHVRFEGEAWAVNLVPDSNSGPQSLFNGGEPQYKVAFIDAHSGKLIFTVQVDAPPPGGWPTEPPPNYVTPAAE